MGEVAVGGGMEEMEKGTAGENTGEEQGGGVVRWEKFLPRMFLRVLLVEADDSTRHIIAALLRKCGYRVAAASDGLKAWETLKEKSQNIDLVLTEVELPSVSGYGLLTMIMEHEICKNIPVIMMSSHDSINIVFKCMLMGAADFLVKPIRKNELRNLWQHVWRRQSSNGGPGGTCGHQVVNLTQLKSEANSENNAASNHSSDCIDSLQKNRECSKKGSDTQSSCTRPDMEAESGYVQSLQEQGQPNCIDFSVTNHMRNHRDDISDTLDEELPASVSKVEDRSPLNADHHSQVINSSDCILEKEDSNARVTAQRFEVSAGCEKCLHGQYASNGQKSGQSKPSQEVDLIGAMDHQPQCDHGPKNCNAVQADASNDEILDAAYDQKFKPSLELSLRRCQHIITDNQDKDEFNLLNHSHSSAFSRYNGRTALFPLSAANDFRRSELKDYSSYADKPSRDQGLFQSSAANTKCNSTQLNMNLEDTGSTKYCLPNQDGTSPRSSLGLLPIPVPISGIKYDGLHHGYGSVMQPIFYTQPALPVWGLNPTNLETAHASLSHQSDGDILNSGQSSHVNNQNAVRQVCEAEKEHMQNVESLEKQHVSSVTGQSSSSICNGSRSHHNSSGGSSVCNGSNGNLTAICNGSAIDVSRSNMESPNGKGLFSHDGINLVDFQRTIQREAALNKFRLKRKDRCFEKKVRYQSRKKLAEQRPRVKGQFVRQVKLDP